jgi:hypothetical protein
LGALAVLTCYALATSVLDARWALLAPATLTIVPLQIWFARDAYSELIVEVLVLGGLWLFLESRRRASWILAIGAGVMIASATMARIDALLFVSCALVIAAVEWTRTEGDERARYRLRVAAFTVALLAIALLGIEVTRRTNLAYIRALKAEYHDVLASLAFAIVLSVVVVLLHRLRPGLGRRLASQRSLVISAFSVVGAVAVWAYVWRPQPSSALLPSHPHMTRAQVQTVDRWYFSRSLHWFTDYFGVIGVIVAIGGACLLAAWALRGCRGASAICIMAFPPAVAYLARPSITPDQPWAMRRFLPVALPGIAIAIAVALTTLIVRAWRARSVAGRVGGAALAAIATLGFLLPAAHAAIPFRRARIQYGALSAVHKVCSKTKNDSAVFIFGAAYLDLELPQTIRAFCGIPAATSAHGYIDLRALSAEWRARGRRLVVATGTPAQFKAQVPSAIPLGSYSIPDTFDLERPRTHAPRGYAPRPLIIDLFEIPPAAEAP